MSCWEETPTRGQRENKESHMERQNARGGGNGDRRENRGLRDSGDSKGWRNMGGVSTSVYVFPCPDRQHAH